MNPIFPAVAKLFFIVAVKEKRIVIVCQRRDRFDYGQMENYHGNYV